MADGVGVGDEGAEQTCIQSDLLLTPQALGVSQQLSLGSKVCSPHGCSHIWWCVLTPTFQEVGGHWELGSGAWCWSPVPASLHPSRLLCLEACGSGLIRTEGRM